MCESVQSAGQFVIILLM